MLSGSNVKYAIPYKIFDYISVQRPILAVAPKNSEVEGKIYDVTGAWVADIDTGIVENSLMWDGKAAERISGLCYPG